MDDQKAVPVKGAAKKKRKKKKKKKGKKLRGGQRDPN